MGGHHHEPVPQMPDFRQYRVEDVPVLQELKEKLARRGLKDPWLRNEVWRYQVVPYSTRYFRDYALPLMSRGFKYGLIIALVTTAISKTFRRKVEHYH